MDCDTVIRIYDSGGTLLTGTNGDDDGGDWAKASKLQRTLAAGLYYIKVTNKDGLAGGTYKLRADVTD